MGKPADRSNQSADIEVAELVEGARAGSREAWEGLVDRFAGLVWAVARSLRLDASDAADVSQTTWLKLLQNLDRIEKADRVGGWLATTARRESLRVLRLSGRQLPTADDIIFDLVVSSEGIDKDLVDRETSDQLGLLINKLPTRCQLILRALSSDDALSYREFSEAMDMPVGSIGPTRARCLEHLRRLARSAGLLGDDSRS